MYEPIISQDSLHLQANVMKGLQIQAYGDQVSVKVQDLPDQGLMAWLRYDVLMCNLFDDPLNPPRELKIATFWHMSEFKRRGHDPEWIYARIQNNAPGLLT